MPVIVKTVLLLVASNLFMTFAWYGHLKNLSSKPWYIAALVSWGIAFFEYMIQVPANRIGYGALSLAQLKILQERRGVPPIVGVVIAVSVLNSSLVANLKGRFSMPGKQTLAGYGDAVKYTV